MSLLYPWRLYFSAIAAAVVGSIVGIIKALMPVIKLIFEALLSLTKMVANGFASLAEMFAHFMSGIYKAIAAVIGGIAQLIPESLMPANGALILRTLQGMFEMIAEQNVFWDVAKVLREIATSLGVAIDGIRDIERNTQPELEDVNLWINTQLRDLAGKSPLYPKPTPGMPQPEFWHPPGSAY